MDIDKFCEFSSDPREITQGANSVALNLLPEKSRGNMKGNMIFLLKGAIQKESRRYQKTFYLHILRKTPR